MKRISILISAMLLVLVSSLAAQRVQDTETYELFMASADANGDTTFMPADSTFYVLETQAGATTVESKSLQTVYGGGDIWVGFRIAKSVSGSVNAKLQIGLWRGYGFGVDGYEWVDLAIRTSVGSTNVKVYDVSAVKDFWFSRYKYRIVETGSQQNWYVIIDHNYMRS